LEKSKEDTTTLGLSEFSIATAEGARGTLDFTDLALEQLNGVRGQIGAGESRLESTLNNLMIYEESMSGAYSQIRDTDMALETSNLAKYGILNQAGVAVLAQANSAPKLALKLLE
jgi:flagellin